MFCLIKRLDGKNPNRIEKAQPDPLQWRNRIRRQHRSIVERFLYGSSEYVLETYHSSAWPFPTAYFSSIFDRRFHGNQDNFP